MPNYSERPEPDGWTLMDAIADLKKTVTEMPDKMVAKGTYDADQRGINERFLRIEGRATDLETKSSERDKAQAAQQDANDKFARQQRLSITLVVVGPIITLVVGYLFGHGGGM